MMRPSSKGMAIAESIKRRSMLFVAGLVDLLRLNLSLLSGHLWPKRQSSLDLLAAAIGRSW
jgi:hypothetical protein